MQVKISGKHVELTPALEEYAQKKSEKLQRFFDRVMQVEVVVDKVKQGSSCEIIVTVEHHEPIVSHVTHEDLYASIDLCVDRAVRQLTDYKNRVRDHKKHMPTSGTGPR